MMTCDTDLPYDAQDCMDILQYAEKLVSKTFAEVLEESLLRTDFSDEVEYYDSSQSKGGLGNLLEKYYFMYEPNSLSQADFPDAGVELKVTPYERTKKGLRAGERLVISMIPNTEAIAEDFKDNFHLQSKLSKILMIWYLRERKTDNNLVKKRTDYRIDFVNLYDLYSEVCKKDLAIIREDYRKIAEKIIAGKAHELSESDTTYLGACTKGVSAKKSLQPQWYNKEILAKRRAFSLKQSYMTYVLNHYVITGQMSYDSICTEEELQNSSFESQVIKKISVYKGKTEEWLYRHFALYRGKVAKQKNQLLVCRMLGVRTDNAEEFQKANIAVKTIRVQRNGRPKESMSFPKITIGDFVRQEFETSYEYTYFSETRFLFVVFQEAESGEYVLQGAKFWNMPMTDLESDGREDWQRYKEKFLAGVCFDIQSGKNGAIRVRNDLPKKTETNIFHLRPHSAKSAYVIHGVRYGNGSDADMDCLPDGNKMTNQCFWLNNDYVAKIICDIKE